MRQRPSQLTGVLLLALSVLLLVNSCTYQVLAAPANLPASYPQQQPDCAVFLGEGRLIAAALAILDSIKLNLHQLIDSIRASLKGTLGSFDKCVTVSKPVLTVRLGMRSRRGRRSCEAEEKSHETVSIDHVSTRRRRTL
jgi:hypothetical protein